MVKMMRVVRENSDMIMVMRFRGNPECGEG
jgi:hypothetical protein